MLHLLSVPCVGLHVAKQVRISPNGRISRLSTSSVLLVGPWIRLDTGPLMTPQRRPLQSGPVLSEDYVTLPVNEFTVISHKIINKLNPNYQIVLKAPVCN